MGLSSKNWSICSSRQVRAPHAGTSTRHPASQLGEQRGSSSADAADVLRKGQRSPAEKAILTRAAALGTYANRW